MGTYTGLGAFTDAITPYETRPKATWFTLDNGKSVGLRFLSEVDPDSRFYNPDNGLVLLATEHVSPHNFKVKASCTKEDEGRCWACEEAMRFPRTGWGVKKRAYFNVLVDNGKDAPFVAIWQMSVGPRSTNAKLIQTYASSNGGISGNEWRVTRSGTGKDTNYILIPGAADATPFDWSGYEPWDLDEYAVRRVAYSDQEAHFMEDSGGFSFAATSEPKSATPDSSSEIW